MGVDRHKVNKVATSPKLSPQPCCRLGNNLVELELERPHFFVADVRVARSECYGAHSDVKKLIALVRPGVKD